MGAEPPFMIDVLKRVEQRSVGNGTTNDLIAQEGSRPTVRVTQLCDAQRVTWVERATMREHQNKASRVIDGLVSVPTSWLCSGWRVLSGQRGLKGSDGRKHTKADQGREDT